MKLSDPEMFEAIRHLVELTVADHFDCAPPDAAAKLDRHRLKAHVRIQAAQADGTPLFDIEWGNLDEHGDIANPDTWS